jgi:flagellar biosynthesis protein FlhB
MAEAPVEEDESQKVFDATPRKLQQAREKGDVAKSQDVATAFVLIASAAIFLGTGGWMAAQLAADLTVFFERPHEIAMDAGAANRLAASISFKGGLVLAAAFAAMAVAALAGHLVQGGLLFTTEKMKPKPDKISPVAGFKRLFGPEALIQFLKTVIKVSVLGIVAYVILAPRWKQAESLVQMEPAAIMPVLMEVLLQLLFLLLIVVSIAAAADYAIQRFQWLKRNKMSKQELKDEYRQTEGDPHLKAKLRQIRMERGRQRMMANVPGATVVITNPTHYAVALRYEAGKDAAPVCVAKGLDRVALRIREIAGEHEVPVIEDPPLARALHASVDIDDPIPVEHYAAVAKIIGVILSVAARRKSVQPSTIRPQRPDTIGLQGAA